MEQVSLPLVARQSLRRLAQNWPTEGAADPLLERYLVAKVSCLGMPFREAPVSRNPVSAATWQAKRIAIKG
jgi:hypothetical protein